MSLPGCAAIPGALSRARPDRPTRRARRRDRRGRTEASDIITRKALENVIVANSAIGGSTNAPIHINAIARHIGVELDVDDWEKVGHKGAAARQHAAGGLLSRREYYRAGGLPGRHQRADEARLIHEDALTINGRTMGENCRGREVDRRTSSSRSTSR